jgi:hypothetical protein
MRERAFFGAFVALFIVSAAAQDSIAVKPYDVAEAYQIYDLLVPKEESYRITQDSLLIRQQTVGDSALSPKCLTPEAESKFRDAIAAFNDMASTKWLLQPKFQVGKPYELVGKDVLAALPHEQGKGAYLEMSAVGFNHEKTHAVVFISSKCSGLCGSSKYHLVQKTLGRWKEVSGVTCATTS